MHMTDIQLGIACLIVGAFIVVVVLSLFEDKDTWLS